MFSGTYTPKVDDKGRLFLPAKFREAMKEGLVITRGQDRALDVRTMSAFADFTEKFRTAQQTNAQLRAYGRMLFALASEQTPDKQGRITLTPELREYAGVDRDVVVLGVYDRLEIWEPDAWQRYTGAQEQAFADLSEEIFPSF
ncbi:division/cell wall cluster transcriptional repressor MraZ [Nocardioides aequoreus]|uniref:division/cell wall cluster transcriptional repressor MraZ n=1 Tax=Nocardioides aequoreus TaxID=397278 RepID=UPI0004C43D64|nr:division/cell wall cluster transcriptional repressor MraZ [Nocardioides aequoreus]